MLMSSRRKRDYKAVFRAIKEEVDTSPQRIVADFEAAAWKAATAVFRDVEIKGCNFHWRQAVWRKVCVFNYRKKFHTFVFIVAIILHTITKYLYLYMIFFFHRHSHWG